MKRTYVLILTLCLSLFAAAKTELGIGVIVIDFSENTVVEFYDSPELNLKPVKSIMFYDDHVNQVWKIKNMETHKSWLKPEAYNPLYDLLAFRCISKKDGWIEVMVNNNTGQTFWIKSSDITLFSDWLTFLQKGKCISRGKTEVQILEKPEENAKQIEFNGKDCFGIKSMKDEWIEITIPMEDKKGDSEEKTGWMKWKNGNDLLIKYSIGS